MKTFGLSPDYLFFKHLSQEEDELFNQGFHLLHHTRTMHEETLFTDYSFVVFPFSKAYEGHLKRIFYEKHLISEHSYKSKYFRVGKSLSPNLVKILKDKSAYLQLINLVGQVTTDKVWDAWKTCRNEIFHYFPESNYHISFTEAESRIKKLLDVCEELFVRLQ